MKMEKAGALRRETKAKKQQSLVLQDRSVQLFERSTETFSEFANES